MKGEKKVSNVVKCPKCGSTNIREDGRYDPIDNGDYIEEGCWGVCLDCKAELEWDAIWTQTAVENIVALPEE